VPSSAKEVLKSIGQLKPSQTVRTVFLGCISTLFAFAMLFAMAEAGFHVAKAAHMRSVARRMSQPNWIVYDPDLIYRPVQLPVPRPKNGAFRVVVLGDSLIGGTHSIVSGLDATMNRDPALIPSEWINTSVPGYTNYQELVYLKKFGLPLQPDLVGVVFSLNDVHKFENNLSVADGRLMPDASFWEPTPEAANASRSWLLRMARRSLFLRWLRGKTRLAGRAVEMYESKGFDFDYRPDYSTAWQDAPWQMIRDQMTEMLLLGKQYHFRVFLVSVPFGEQYRNDYLARDANYVLKPQRTLSTLMSDLQIPFLNLYPYLDNKCFVPADRSHLTLEGKQRAANAIAEFLRKERLLPEKGIVRQARADTENRAVSGPSRSGSR
jgi:lysophospholipase L1-like esterase